MTDLETMLRLTAHSKPHAAPPAPPRFMEWVLMAIFAVLVIVGLLFS